MLIIKTHRVYSRPHSSRAPDSTESSQCWSCEWTLPPSVLSPRLPPSQTASCCWSAGWRWPEDSQRDTTRVRHSFITGMEPLFSHMSGGGRDCAHLSAFNDGLWHKHADLHISVVLRPAVVLSHRPVVAVRVRLIFILTPETQHAHKWYDTANVLCSTASLMYYTFLILPYKRRTLLQLMSAEDYSNLI